MTTLNGTAKSQQVNIDPRYETIKTMYLCGYSYDDIAKRFKKDLGLSGDLVPHILKSNFPDLEVKAYVDLKTTKDKVPSNRIKTIETYVDDLDNGIIEYPKKYNLQYCIDELFNKYKIKPSTEDYKHFLQCGIIRNHLYRVAYEFTTKYNRDKCIDYLHSLGVTFREPSNLRLGRAGKDPYYLSISEI